MSNVNLVKEEVEWFSFFCTYLKLSFCGELKRQSAKCQSKDLLVTVIDSGMCGSERLVDLLDGWRNLWRIEHCITENKTRFKLRFMSIFVSKEFFPEVLHEYDVVADPDLHCKLTCIWALKGLNHVLRWFSVFGWWDQRLILCHH